MPPGVLAYRIDVTDDGRDTRKPGAPARHDADVLVGVLAGLALAVGVVVQVGHGLAKLCQSLRIDRIKP